DAQAVDDDGREEFKYLVARGMTETIVDRFEVIDVEDQSGDRAPRTGFTLDDPCAGFRETATIEHSGQRIDRCGVLVHGDRAFRHHHEDQEHRADGIKYEFDRKDRDPDAAGKRSIVRMQEITE